MAHMQTSIRPAVGSLINDAEHDMRKVQDLAMILHHHMADGASISPEMQAALSWLTAELVQIGERLNERFDTMFDASKGLH